jgi:hypothetical protein
MNNIMLLPPPAAPKARGNHPRVELPPVIELHSNPLYRTKIRKCSGIENNDVYRLSTTLIRDKMPNVAVNLQTGDQTRLHFEKAALMSFICLAGIIRTEPNDEIIAAHFDDLAIDQYGRRAAKIAIVYKKCVEKSKI